MSHFKHAIVVIALLLTLCIAIGVGAQESAPPQDEPRIYIVGDETYEQVLDLLFPRQVLVGAGGYAFVLRYVPPFDAESQITIVNEAGRVEAVEYVSPDGNILDKLNRIYQQTHRIDAAEMAKRIRVEKRIVSLSPAEVESLRQTFYDLIRQSTDHENKQISDNIKEVMIIEDATEYLLWYRGKERSYYDLAGYNLNVLSPPVDEHPLIDWMRGIRRTIKQLQTANNRKP